MNFHDAMNFLDAMNFQMWETFLAHPVYFDKTEKCPIPSLGNSGGRSICSRKSAQGPVYTIPVSFHIGLGKAIRYENFSCLHDAVFIS